MPSFHDHSLLPTLIASLTEQGLVTPTPIQTRTIPLSMQGRSLIGIAETGSGKTLAYILPMLHILKTLETEGHPVTTASRPRGLVVVPGRELGQQVSKVFKGLTHGTRLRVRTAFGGTAKQVARQSVAGKFEILVATPGRLLQLADAGELMLDDVRFIVLDEGDQLLDSGFLPKMHRILDHCPITAQRALFSATLSAQLGKAVASLFVKEPELVRTRGSEQVVRTLKTDNRPTVKNQRRPALTAIFERDATSGTIVFVNTRKHSDLVSGWLTEQSIDHVVLRGEMEGKERRKNMARFRDGEVDVLLTTDLGGRGLDIERVTRVINVFLPEGVDDYLHRVGRTARAGRSGTVINLVTQRDHPLMAKLKQRKS